MLLFACLALSLPSLATAGWSAPAVVSGLGSSVSQTQVAGGIDGTSWVVWKRDVGGFDVIQGTRVKMDGTQGPIVTLSGPTSVATDPVIASRADGSAMVAWLNTSALDDTVHSRTIAADGTLGAIQTRSAVGPAGQPAKDIAIALGGDGTAALTWLKFNGANWIVQGVRVAADDSSTTIQNLSDPGVDAGPPDVGAARPLVEGTPYTYQVMWPQGSGASSNVGARLINADGSVGAVVALFANSDGPDCENPVDVNVTYGSDGALNAFWVCKLKIFGSTTSYFSQSVVWLRLPQGSEVGPVGFIPTASPSVEGVTYTISGVTASETYGGEPVVAWIHDLNGGGQRVETWRVLSNGNPQGWANTQTQGTTIESPAIAANASLAAIAGGVNPGLLPGQPTASFTRFSNNSFGPVVPSGGFVYSDDPGFVVASSGLSMAVFTGIDGASVGSARVMTFKDPATRVDPDNFNFGRSNIGLTRNSFVTIRSTGETPSQVTGITLSGTNADRYALSGQGACLTNMDPGTNCRFKVAFKPGSTATQTAKVTVTSESGVEVVNFTGSGLNRTRNQITAKPGHAARRRGKVVKIRVRVANLGGVTSNNTRVCVNLRKRALKLAGNRCRNLGALAAGARRNLNYRVRVTGRAQRGVRLPVTFVMRANNAVVRQAVVRVRRKGR